MNNKKIIYISFIRLTDKVSRDWYIDYCIQKGAIVEYWDIVSLVREEHNENFMQEADYLRYIRTYQEFEKLILLPENKHAIYVMLISYSGHCSRPFRLLSKYNRKMVFLNWGAMPTTTPSPLLQRIVYRLFTYPIKSLKTIINIGFGSVYRKLNLVKKFDIVFTAGNTLTSTDQYSKKVIPFNLCDFDHYSRLKLSEERVIQGKYAVFLDINLPYQSDLSICNLTAINPTNYFKSLNNFFDSLEIKYGIKVVIAAHPKANYNNEEFKQRECHRLLTAELVKDAEYVITHTSTALSYAVLNLKPILFIYTDEMMSIYKNTILQQINNLATYLNASIFNIDRIITGNQINIKPVDHGQYDTYKYNFLTSRDTENFSSAEIFWREINTL